MTDLPPNSCVIAVTGGIGCGKSAAGFVLRRLDFNVCDADSVAHELMKKGTPVYTKLVDIFGEIILSESGEIDRPKLGAIVFANPDEREKLNSVTHPAIRSYLVEWIRQQRASHKRAAVEVPLLFESGMNDLDWDAVVCISSPDEFVYHRLAARGMDKDRAAERIKAQMPLNEKEKRSDYVVHNNGSLEQLDATLQNVVQRMMVER